MLKMVCNAIQIEPVLQEINGEVLTPGTNRAADARLDIHARGFWERQGSAFFMLESVTQMQSRIEASPQNKSTASMRARRRECTPAECKKSNKAPLHHWYLLPPEEWQMNARGITVDWPNFYQSRRERITVLQCHGFAPKSHSPS